MTLLRLSSMVKSRMPEVFHVRKPQFSCLPIMPSIMTFRSTWETSSTQTSSSAILSSNFTPSRPTDHEYEPCHPETIDPQNHDKPLTPPSHGEPQQQPLTCPIGIIHTEDDRRVRKARKKPSYYLTGYVVQVQVVDCQPSQEPVEESTFKLLSTRSSS
ncbi:hypothetical protein HG536_0E00640 [Torulaspora globosa]|uniref:Uncharacterized protein n=1 Tax=Torulaspora globosa TaxID=48254 RepID=A0A7G3ZI18_9SACH|nr:uncharacterized protein HG536_0E00640 [Torulaspora globosa]QLL33154.1 hypothetical protein HG536_0E00640 [Torulaspora globosa]